jgi:hypothetical protein
MKKLCLFLALTFFISSVMVAQVSPEGMNYQAVARNLKGEILANQPVALMVTLFSSSNNGKNIYYKEQHDVVTTTVGVFSLVIGKGSQTTGTFATIPWDVENIWMEVSIKGRGQADFTTISNSKLLAVPYAFHAMTATKIAGTTNSLNSPGIPSQSWSLFGNVGSSPENDKLGTTDSVDLVIVSNGRERMRVLANGNVGITRSLSIGADLKVDSSVYLNRVAGSTTNYGPFTVDRQSPTLLSGTLTVDKATDLNLSLNVDGITDLNSKLNVNNGSATVLTGSLRVDSITDLNRALNVNNISPTVLTGTLRVDSNASFYNRIKILSTHDTDTSGSAPTGSLQVGGGAYIAKNLFIGGIAKFGGPAAFGGAVTISDPTQSTSPTTGALKVAGGVGIGKNLNVGGKGWFTDSLRVAGVTNISNATQSSTTTNGALLVSGGAGITKNVNIGGALTTAGISTINNVLNVNANSDYAANFSTTGANGISIKVGVGAPGIGNNFVTFKGSGGNTVGRIEGETVGDLSENEEYKVTKDGLTLVRDLAVLDATIGAADIVVAAIELGAAASSSTVCAGLGVCVTAPIPSLIVAAGINLVAAIANEVGQVLAVDEANDQLNFFVTKKTANIGVTYQSGSGDYAEYLPKANKTDQFKPGFIVGMKNGTISLNTAGADKLFAISTKPIVLGNMPEDGKEGDYEKAAFMGQVPVYVLGKVNIGDYIVPAGYHNGYGKAIAPDKMIAEDYANIVGMAWSASSSNSYSLVNVAIGLNAGDISKLVAEQSKEITDLKSQISQTNNLLAKLVPGFADAAGIKTTAAAVGNTTASIAAPVGTVAKNVSPGTILKQDDSHIIYFEVTPAQMNQMIDEARAGFVKAGVDISKHPFWKKMSSDAGYKSAVMEGMKSKLQAAVHMHHDINSNPALQVK